MTQIGRNAGSPMTREEFDDARQALVAMRANGSLEGIDSIDVQVIREVSEETSLGEPTGHILYMEVTVTIRGGVWVVTATASAANFERTDREKLEDIHNRAWKLAAEKPAKRQNPAGHYGELI